MPRFSGMESFGGCLKSSLSLLHIPHPIHVWPVATLAPHVTCYYGAARNADSVGVGEGIFLLSSESLSHVTAASQRAEKR